MPQIRLMGDDRELTGRTLDALLRALNASPELVVGDVANRPPRGDGARFYIEVLPVGCAPAEEVTVTVERDSPRPPRRRGLPRSR
ncbi:hypothetical protein [Streptomyces sp. NPDC058751]|uniref:hypothetical protein n=1 Tax=Streptomyces sp. NPDC058751 TaxID=3346623 RepID=UPI0036B32AEF